MFMKNYHQYGRFAVCLTFSSCAYASDLSISELSLYSELPVVLGATRLEQPREQTPASVTLIDRELIEASGAVEIAELFKLVPGFQVSEVTGNQLTVGTHGIVDQFTRRIEIQINGRSIYKSANSTVNWNLLGITLDEVERIEVVRGPHASAHGSNAFKGVINIITRDPLFDPVLSLKFERGSNNFQHGIVAFSDQSEKLNYRLSIGNSLTDGYDNLGDSSEVNLLSFRGLYQIDARQNLDIQLSYAAGPFSVRIDAPSTNNPDRERDITTEAIDLKWTKELSAEEDISVQFYRNTNSENDLYSLGLLSAAFGAGAAAVLGEQEILHGVYNYSSEQNDLEIQHRLRPSENTRLAWGGGFRQDRLRSLYLLNSNDYIDDFSQRMFGNLEWNPQQKLYLNVGAMVEHNETIGALMSSRLAANYLVSDRHTIRASASRGYRTPSLLYSNFDYGLHLANGNRMPAVLFPTLILPPENLKPETIDSYELGYLFSLPEFSLDADLKLYYEDMSNLISLAELGGGQAQVTSKSYAQGRGAELELRWRPDIQTLLSLQYAYADIDGGIHEAISPEIYEPMRPFVPKRTASLLVSRQFGEGWLLAGTAYYLDKMAWFGEGELLGAYTRLDAKLAKKIILNDAEGELSLIGQNILDRQYYEYRDKNLFEPRIYLRAKLTF